MFVVFMGAKEFEEKVTSLDLRIHAQAKRIEDAMLSINNIRTKINELEHSLSFYEASRRELIDMGHRFGEISRKLQCL